MPRLIDANEILKSEHQHYDYMSDEYYVLVRDIENAPTVEAEPVRRGRWIKNEDRSGWHCSCCGKDDLYAYPYTENNERELQDFYCPNCGAKMDEVEE